MLKVPFYTTENYQTILSKPYDMQDTSSWVDFQVFLELLTEKYVQKYATVPANRTDDYKVDYQLKTKKMFVHKERTLHDILAAAKLLMPTLWGCDRHLRNIQQ